MHYTRETGWLIEFPHGPEMRLKNAAWWCGGQQLTTNASAAARFGTREQAVAAIADSPWLAAKRAFPTEHCWGFS
jgi:hypothetical protein